MRRVSAAALPVTAVLLALAPASAAAEEAVAVFAGGCFWSMEPPFDAVPGVLSTTTGYTGGDEEAPTYEQVALGRTNHVEAVRVVYDPAKVGYATLLEVFWRTINPFDGGGQFCDRGDSYRTAVFAVTPEQRRMAEASREAVAALLDRRVKTDVADAGRFWPAEEPHQDFYLKNPEKYLLYRLNCGRDARLADIWGDVPPLDLSALR
ncbi:MAG: peptide-methionine (S)-S-oxide reductase MsrA [Caenispirillum bisanense]|nr:peptide-methionine (S)-S-oxide reductase MsrA [Caenispirillum bisanense]MCA1973698.1 peptide-methionine (S)-S-oxide reductase MsrA [Caenispirillum sp.]